MTALLIFICLTLGLAIMAGSFYFGYKIGMIKKISDDNKIYLENASDEIKRLESIIETLSFEKEQILTDLKRGQTTQPAQPNGWNPFNPLDDTPR